MPGRRTYRRRRHRNLRRRRKNTKLSVYTRKGARSQSRQIWKNQTQITALRAKVKQTYTRNFYSAGVSFPSIVYPGSIAPLVDPGSWQGVFSTQAGGQHSYENHARLGHCHIRGMVQVETGTAVSSVDIYVLQLPKATAQQTRAQLGELLVNLTQVNIDGQGTWNNRYYYNYGTATLEGRRGTMMNPRAFKIRAHRRFLVGDEAFTTVAGEGTSVTNIKDSNKPFDIKLTHPIKLEIPVGTLPDGTARSWKTMSATDIPDHQQLYLFISANSVEGTQLFCNFNYIWSVSEPN